MMDPADGSRPTWAFVTKDAAHTTANLVPRKRKAHDEIRQPDKTFYLSPKEGINDYNSCASVDEAAYDECYEYFWDTDEDLDQVYTAISKKRIEEDALRAEAELDAYHIALRVEKDFDENGDLFQELHDDYDIDCGWRTKDDVLFEERIQSDLIEKNFDEDRDHEDGDLLQEFYDSHHIDYGWQTKDDVLFEERIQSGSTESVNSKLQNDLCRRCRAVRWSALARMSLSERHLVCRLRDSPLKLLDSACKLCQFLGRIGNCRASLEDSRDGTLEFDLSICRSHKESTRILIISINGESEGSLVTLHSTTHTEQWSPRITDLNFIDFHSLRRMFSQCRRHHADTCNPKPGVKFSGFKVIDCVSREVIQAPKNCKYVALSYVWGNLPEVKGQELFKLCYSVTVEDSLRVTIEMGFRYLWVDRYCIDQRNKVEKHECIRNMDQVYNKAQLTIIAAAGNDPTYGLPGVRSKPRSRQHHVCIGNIKLVQLMRPGLDFPKSSWWERAWTYQEGVLSKRKLVFTDHQVFYVCDKMHLAESLNMHTASAVDADTSSFFKSVTFNEMVLPTGPKSYESYLRDISRRTLSHQSDALNACLGILKATNTTHVWGIPIEFESVSGNHTIALCWRHGATTNRRRGFPSWSWTGWKGVVTFQDSIVTSPFCTIFLEDGHQNWQTLDEYVSSGRAEEAAGKTNAPRLLKMTGSALDAAWLDDQWPDMDDFGAGATGQQDDRPKPHFLLEFDGLFALAIFYLDQEIKNAEQLQGVIAMGVKPGSEDSCISALLLKPNGDFYTRVGMMELSCEDQTCKRPYELHSFWELRAETRTVIIQ